MSTLI
jgi:hypothetical protein